MSMSKAKAERLASEILIKEIAKQAKQLDMFPDHIDYSSVSTASLTKQTARLLSELQKRMTSLEGRLFAKGSASGERGGLL